MSVETCRYTVTTKCLPLIMWAVNKNTTSISYTNWKFYNYSHFLSDKLFEPLVLATPVPDTSFVITGTDEVLLWIFVQLLYVNMRHSLRVSSNKTTASPQNI